MHEHTLEDRKLLWRMFFAQAAFDSAAQAMQLLIEQNLTNDHAAYQPLVTAAVITYGRPFKQSHRVGRLPEDMVPDEFKDTHGGLIMMRDKFMAHTDVDAPLLEDSGAANQVLFKNFQGRQVLFLKTLHPRPPLWPKAIALSQLLSEKCRYHVNKLRNRHNALDPPADGEYVLNVDPSVDAFVTKQPDLHDGYAIYTQPVTNEPA
jgi:hypothetical protein